MYLLNVCENPDILRIIFFSMKILDFLFIIIPISLVVFITIDLFKIVTSADNDKAIKENRQNIINRITFAIVLFFVPTIVSAIMGVLSEVGINSDYKTCLTNANKQTITALQIKQENEEKEKNQDKVLSTGNIYKDLANEMVRIATNELGIQEGKNNDNKYGQALNNNKVPWCAIFVTWVAQKTEINNINLYRDIITKNDNNLSYASTTGNIMHFYTQNNLDFYPSNYYDGNYTPKPGDYIFFDLENEWNKITTHDNIKKAAKHTGLVVEVKNGKVYTIEGNAGKPEMVRKKEYNLNNNNILGYGSWYK